MAGDEIEREFVCGAIGEKVLQPDGPPVEFLHGIDIAGDFLERSCLFASHGKLEITRRRSANPERGVDFLHSLGRILVELEILLLGSSVEEEIEIRFVPHLEVPLPDLLDAIALDAMPQERFDEGTPLRFVARGYGVCLPPEATEPIFLGGNPGSLRFLLLFGKNLRLQRVGWIESKLHKGPNPHRQQAVEHIVHILPVVDRLPILADLVNEHVVMEEAVKTHELEAALVVHEFHLLQPTRAESLVRTSRPDTGAPEFIQWFARGGGIRGNANGFFIRLGGLAECAQGDRDDHGKAKKGNDLGHGSMDFVMNGREGPNKKTTASFRGHGAFHATSPTPLVVADDSPNHCEESIVEPLLSLWILPPSKLWFLPP